MMFNNYLFYDLKINYIFPTPDWYIYVHLALFFPVTGILSMDTSLPLTNHNLLIIIVSIAANGFIYAIIFSFIAYISRLFRLLIKGEMQLQSQECHHMESFYVLVYFCGFVGCAAFTLIPARSFRMIAAVVSGGIFKVSRKILLAFAILASISAFLYEIRILLRVYNCLTNTHCTLPRIRMWMYLTMFGTVYLAFEAVFFIVRKVNFAMTRKQPKLNHPRQNRG